MTEAILPGQTRDAIEAVGDDTKTGARGLALKAAAALRELPALLHGESAERMEETIFVAARGFLRAGPMIAPLVSLANMVLTPLSQGLPPERIARDVARQVDTFIRRMELAAAVIAEHGASIIPDGGTVFTHSASSTVLDAFRRAIADGRRFAVICTESRPAREGAEFAELLAREDIDTTLIVDAAVARHVGDADLVLVGADAITADGLIHKVGTAPLALAASACEVPFYSLAGTVKLLPAEYEPPPEPGRDPRAVHETGNPRLVVENFTFDLTPLDFITGVIVEDGALGPDDVRERIGGLVLHPALRIEEDTDDAHGIPT